MNMDPDTNEAEPNLSKPTRAGRAQPEEQEHMLDLLQLLVDSVRDYAIILLDTKGNVLTWNNAAAGIKGWKAEEIVGCHFSRFYPPEDIDKPEMELRIAALEGRFEDEGWRVRKDGIRFWANVIITSLRDKNGTLRGFGKVTRDLTERKNSERVLERAKQEAETSNHAKDEFLSRMSHELRTPLNSILGFAQLLQMGGLSSRPRECVEHILKAGRHLLTLINELLDISRINSGNLALSPEAVDLTQSIHQALELMRPIAAESGVLICDAARLDSDQYVHADRHRLQQVLLNLLSNAIKYNRPAGTVEVSSKNVASGRVRVSIKDTGVGIAPEYQTRVFAPFERLHAGQNDVQGTGLGLSVSKKLIELMGGRVGFESQPGLGSTFWIELSSSEEPSKRIGYESSQARAVPRSRSVKTILCVDDNTANQRLMEHLFAHRPQTHLVLAMQGRMALELAFRHIPDLILLDLHLPDLSGDIVLQQLRAHPSTQKIPIVMVSADATPGQIQRLLEAGATYYVTKPLEIEMLLRIVDEHLT